MDKLPNRSMLLKNFNQRLEDSLREKYDIDPKIPVVINWADDGSCIMSIIVGRVESIFTYLGYEDVTPLLQEFFDADEVESIEDTYWPGNSISLAFKEFRKSVGITDPKVNCGAHLPDEHLRAWEDVWEERRIVRLNREDQ